MTWSAAMDGRVWVDLLARTEANLPASAAAMGDTAARTRRTAGTAWKQFSPAMGLVALTALFCSGFVHRKIKERRSGSVRVKRMESRLEFEQAQYRTRAQRRQRTRHLRRTKGKGLAGGRWDQLAVHHLSYGAKDVDGGSRLGAAQIRAVMRRFDGKIGGCLLRYQAGGVAIRLNILGTGQLAAVETDLAGKADRCIRNAVQSARFPSFRGTRTTGMYRLRVRR